MSLVAGQRVGSYEIVAPLGSGGMGDVYRARDTKLHRDVAIKVLHDSVGALPDRLTRFAREAQVLASFNHPNIAQIYGVEEHAPDATAGRPGQTTTGPSLALVMELVDGASLDKLVRPAGLPLDVALPIARQIVEALEAAHEQGIIHRDLKPSNVKVRPDGVAKVLDFGLAKAMDPTASGPAAHLESTTVASPAMTAQGLILGTAAYMSPEQARGKSVDKRADIWAFGCVLYEMLTGRVLFGAETVSDVLASILAFTVLASDSFYYQAAVLDPAARSFTLLPVSVDGDVATPGWAPDGRVMAQGRQYLLSLWHYTQNRAAKER